MSPIQPAGRRIQLGRNAKHGHGHSRGQSIVIFALSLTVLLGLAGLSIDVMRMYDMYARELRAAEAGAIAGVMYLPCYYDTASSASCGGSASPDGNSAVSRAMQEVYRNGFGALPAGPVVSTPCPAVVSSQPVSVCTVSGKATDLQVTVSQTISAFLLSVAGVTSVNVFATAQAEYMAPIQVGSRTAYFGDQMECSNPAGPCDPNNNAAGVVHLQNFRAVINGPADLKEFGDPYVYCEGGPSLAPPPDSGGPYTANNGITTNHPQYASPNCGVPGPGNTGNSDQQPDGYCGPATCGTSHPGAKNYAITVDSVPATVWVYNGNYDPSDLSGWSALDHFQCGCQTKYGALTFANGYYDDQSMYFTTTYALYQTPNIYLRSTDKLVTQMAFPPYDMMTKDLNLHCPGQSNVAYDLSDNSTYSGKSISAGTGCVSLSNTQPTPCIHAWCQIATITTAGTYRLTVETTGVTNSVLGWGSKQYGLKICGPGGYTPTTLYGCATGPNTTLAAWNNMTVYYASPSAAADFDLAYIPSTYAGRTINVNIFDPGDSSGNVYVDIIPPAGSGITVTYPTGIRTATDPSNNVTGILASSAGDTIYNGLWIKTPVTLPPGYAGGWWQIHYNVSSGTPSDTVTVAFDTNGSPVHLVQLG